MTQPYDAEGLPSPSSALLQLARLKAGISQRELADRAGVPVTMISAYERDQRQPTLTTLLKLLRAAGFDLRLHLAAYDPHDDILAGLEAGRSESERRRRDEQLQAWRQASVADLADVIRSKESAGRPKDLRVLPLLYRHQSMRRDGDG
jgi:transcriptional regulator with XRE-family HTH domain